ncbi:hypothetical protein HDU76_009278 [Blyttiomyces sp. JEL0837]|nr:hypothetical protein HDU76_009278 [Blyttiomyces sp. JEL0837]
MTTRDNKVETKDEENSMSTVNYVDELKAKTSHAGTPAVNTRSEYTKSDIKTELGDKDNYASSIELSEQVLMKNPNNTTSDKARTSELDTRNISDIIDDVTEEGTSDFQAITIRNVLPTKNVITSLQTEIKTLENQVSKLTKSLHNEKAKSAAKDTLIQKLLRELAIYKKDSYARVEKVDPQEPWLISLNCETGEVNHQDCGDLRDDEDKDMIDEESPLSRGLLVDDTLSRLSTTFHREISRDFEEIENEPILVLESLPAIPFKMVAQHKGKRTSPGDTQLENKPASKPSSRLDVVSTIVKMPALSNSSTKVSTCAFEIEKPRTTSSISGSLTAQSQNESTSTTSTTKITPCESTYHDTKSKIHLTAKTCTRQTPSVYSEPLNQTKKQYLNKSKSQ